MRYITKRFLLCLLCSFFYVYYVIRNYNPFSYSNIFCGVKFNGHVFFYAATIYLFGIVVFCSFGNTQKYINGYGILELVRNKKRETVIGKIVKVQMLNLLKITVSILAMYIVVSYFFLGKRERFDIIGFTIDILLFYLVSLSIVLWQAFFEILFDSRIGVLITMSIICVHICVGDVIMLLKKSQYLLYFFYTNFALVARREELYIDKVVMFFIII